MITIDNVRVSGKLYRVTEITEEKERARRFREQTKSGATKRQLHFHLKDVFAERKKEGQGSREIPAAPVYQPSSAHSDFQITPSFICTLSHQSHHLRAEGNLFTKLIFHSSINVQCLEEQWKWYQWLLTGSLRVLHKQHIYSNTILIYLELEEV